MTKIKKVKKRKQYRYTVNRKRQSKKLRRRPKADSVAVNKLWENRKSTKQNMSEMGLSHDVNETIEIPSNKPKFMRPKKSVPPTFVDKSVVAMELEEDAKAPREKKFRLPNGQVYWLSKLIDKYGEDYKAMARDQGLNYMQDTWKQIRAKIKKFKSIPEQYEEYLKKKQEQETIDS